MRLLVTLLGTALISGFATAQEDAPEEAVSTDPRVSVVTSAGSFVIELDADRAPLTVENFLAYAREGHYNGTVFHRVIQGFVAQAGRLHRRFSVKKRGQDRRQRVGQRAQQPARHHWPGAHLRSAFRQFTVLHQSRRQSGLEPAANPLGIYGIRHGGRRHGNRR